MRHVDPTDERKLVVRAKEGDMEAYECLVRSYERPIYYLCLRMAGAPQTADDLAQETFIRAYGALSGFKEDRNFYVWLRRIAVNASLNHLRAAKRKSPWATGNRTPVGICLKTSSNAARSRASSRKPWGLFLPINEQSSFSAFLKTRAIATSPAP